MPKQSIRTDNAPKPVGPYSQAIRTGNLLFVSGQGALDPKTGQPVRDSVEVEARQVMENLKAILEAAGSSLDRVVKSTCYVTDLADFQTFNKVYGEYFTSDPPARTTIQAARLPLDFRVEVDVIATVD
ncbi:MAG TPA: RidA family protein [Chloroflexota bacterium]|nr:RidA family protein [Chloroflexota bacterium]